MKKTIKPIAALAPCPVAMVSCGSLEKSNILTISWAGIISSEPTIVYVSVRPSRYSYEILKETGEFVINLPTRAQVKQADLCGTKSGKEMDKFKECGFTKALSSKVSAPYIKECPINLECKVQEIKDFGTHQTFIAEVVSINADEELVDENGSILFEKADLISFAGKKYFATNEVVGYRGICLEE